MAKFKVKHVITDEDLTANPEFKGNVGDEVDATIEVEEDQSGDATGSDDNDKDAV